MYVIEKKIGDRFFILTDDYDPWMNSPIYSWSRVEKPAIFPSREIAFATLCDMMEPEAGIRRASKNEME